MAITTLSYAQVSLVKDINLSGSSSPSEFTVLNNQIYFQAGSDIELWTSDGTNLGTVQVIDIRGGGSSVPRSFNVYNNLLYFLANTSSTGASLFQSDGTLNGTTAFYTTFSSIMPEFTIMNNELFFIGAGQELFKTDGTNISQLSTNISGTKHLFNYDDSKLLFQATTQGTSNWELWESDGFTTGTQLLAEIFASTSVGSVPENFTLFNGKVYFTAITNAEGRELWVTDGTVAGTQMIIDLYSGSTGSNPTGLTVFNNALYFAASHPTLGREIFKMSTAETVTSLKNIAPSSGSSNPSNMFVFNGALYFSADDNTNGIELWSSTGFSSTTNMLKDINTGGANPDSSPSNFAEYFGELYFKANDGINGIELWKTNGTNAGTVLVDNINPSGDSNPSDLVVANNILFFSANNGSTGIELWKYQDPSLSINTIELKSSVSLFPNPANSSFSIETNQIINQVTIYDVQGKVVKSFYEALDSYNIEALTSGLYFVNLKTDKGVVNKKLIKQ